MSAASRKGLLLAALLMVGWVVSVAGLLGWLTGGVLDGIPSSLADPFPRLRALIGAVSKHPKVQEWNQLRAKL